MTGVVRIAAPGALGRRLVLPAIAPVVAAHPGLAVELQVSDQRVSLVDSRVDFAVRVGAQVEASLSIRKVGSSAQVLVASRGYVRRNRRPRTLVELSGHGVFSSDDIERRTSRSWAASGSACFPASW